jgi:hypothetical protein
MAAFAILTQLVHQLLAQPVNSLAISSSNPLIPVTNSIPLLQSDYPNVKFWTRHSWMAVSKKASDYTTVKQKAAERGGTQMANGKNVSLKFTEGVVISGHKYSTTHADCVQPSCRSTWRTSSNMDWLYRYQAEVVLPRNSQSIS